MTELDYLTSSLYNYKSYRNHSITQIKTTVCDQFSPPSFYARESLFTFRDEFCLARLYNTLDSAYH